MQSIYEKFYEICSKENKLIIQEFQEDLKKLNSIELDDKYKFDHSIENYPEKILNDSFFSISLSENYILFILTTDFNKNYNFSTTLSYSNKEDLYGIDFNIFNKLDVDKDRFTIFLLKTENEFSILDIVNTINIDINSKSSNTNEYENIYIFDNEDIINIVLENYLSPNELKDILLLNEDINFMEDEILSAIINQATILYNYKNNTPIQKLKNN